MYNIRIRVAARPPYLPRHKFLLSNTRAHIAKMNAMKPWQPCLATRIWRGFESRPLGCARFVYRIWFKRFGNLCVAGDPLKDGCEARGAGRKWGSWSSNRMMMCYTAARRWDFARSSPVRPNNSRSAMRIVDLPAHTMVKLEDVYDWLNKSWMNIFLYIA